MHEAKGSFNGYFRSPQGNKDQFTLRQADDQSDADFVACVRAFNELLAANGWTEWNGSESPAPSAAAPSNNGNHPSAGSGQAFEVESIKLAAGGEHPRWVVKGGNFLRYGVTCWPETLEATGSADKLDPVKVNAPVAAGWPTTPNARTTKAAGLRIRSSASNGWKASRQFSVGRFATGPTRPQLSIRRSGS